METVEALIAFLTFLAFLSLYIPLASEDPHYTLTHYHIAEDVWRVLYLKHGIWFFYPVGERAALLRQDLDELAEMTKVCIRYEAYAFSYTSPHCPGRSGNVAAVVRPRMVGWNGLYVS